MRDNIGMTTGKRIKEARRAAGLTQKELAGRVGIAQATLSELETGESAGTTSIATFAAVLGVNALWLETGKGIARPLALAPTVEVDQEQLFSEKLAKLVILFGLASSAGQDMILDSATVADKKPTSNGLTAIGGKS